MDYSNRMTGLMGYLDRCTGSMVCSKQLFREALNHPFDEPKQWEIREVNDIMNHCVSGLALLPPTPGYLRATAGRRAGSVKPRQRIPATEPKKSRRDLWRSQSRWSFPSEKSGETTARCTPGCQPVADPVAGEKPVMAGLSPL